MSKGICGCGDDHCETCHPEQDHTSAASVEITEDDLRKCKCGHVKFLHNGPAHLGGCYGIIKHGYHSPECRCARFAPSSEVN